MCAHKDPTSHMLAGVRLGYKKRIVSMPAELPAVPPPPEVEHHAKSASPVHTEEVTVQASEPTGLRMREEEAASVTAVSAGVSKRGLPWPLKFRQAVNEWFAGHVSSSSRPLSRPPRLLVVHGPPGSGKRSFVGLAAEGHGLKVEVPEDVDTIAAMVDFCCQSKKSSRPLSSCGGASLATLLLREAPGHPRPRVFYFFGLEADTDDTGALPVLLSALQSGSLPPGNLFVLALTEFSYALRTLRTCRAATTVTLPSDSPDLRQAAMLQLVRRAASSARVAVTVTVGSFKELEALMAACGPDASLASEEQVVETPSAVVLTVLREEPPRSRQGTATAQVLCAPSGKAATDISQKTPPCPVCGTVCGTAPVTEAHRKLCTAAMAAGAVGVGRHTCGDLGCAFDLRVRSRALGVVSLFTHVQRARQAFINSFVHLVTQAASEAGFGAKCLSPDTWGALKGALYAGVLERNDEDMLWQAAVRSAPAELLTWTRRLPGVVAHLQATPSVCILCSTTSDPDGAGPPFQTPPRTLCTQGRDPGAFSLEAVLGRLNRSVQSLVSAAEWLLKPGKGTPRTDWDCVDHVQTTWGPLASTVFWASAGAAPAFAELPMTAWADVLDTRSALRQWSPFEAAAVVEARAWARATSVGNSTSFATLDFNGAPCKWGAQRQEVKLAARGAAWQAGQLLDVRLQLDNCSVHPFGALAPVVVDPWLLRCRSLIASGLFDMLEQELRGSVLPPHALSGLCSEAICSACDPGVDPEAHSLSVLLLSVDSAAQAAVWSHLHGLASDLGCVTALHVLRALAQRPARTGPPCAP